MRWVLSLLDDSVDTKLLLDGDVADDRLFVLKLDTLEEQWQAVLWPLHLRVGCFPPRSGKHERNLRVGSRLQVAAVMGGRRGGGRCLETKTEKVNIIL